MTTPVRPFRERRQAPLSMGARRWLLGADSRMDKNGGVKHGSIVRWRYLIAHIPNAEDWAGYLADRLDVDPGQAQEHSPSVGARSRRGVRCAALVGIRFTLTTPRRRERI